MRYINPGLLLCKLPNLKDGTEYIIQVTFDHQNFTPSTRYCTFKCLHKRHTFDLKHRNRAIRNFKRLKQKLHAIGLDQLRLNITSNAYCEIDYESEIDAAFNSTILGSHDIVQAKRRRLAFVERQNNKQY